MPEPLHPFTPRVAVTETLGQGPSIETFDDFFSDAPLPTCPLRNEGTDICESCQ
jgi:hypothetical protein